MGSEIVTQHSSSLQVMSIERLRTYVLDVDADRISVTVGLRRATFVESREFLLAVGKDLALDTPADRVQAPALKPCLGCLETLARLVEHSLVHHCVDDDRTVVELVRISRVEQLARLDLEPSQFCQISGPRQKADSRQMSLIPSIRE